MDRPSRTWEHVLEGSPSALLEIVGRCADYILKDKADCLRVFIHADIAFRAERIVKVYGEREALFASGP